ncbi:MAG: hypothetical protein J6X81_01285 [Muribaculaceae bacterium]|nr:hypothetical protein [Muribaculaceae bacterium]
MEEQVKDRVSLCPDGKYRWTYDVKLLSNPSIFLDLLKVMGMTFVIVYVFMLVIMLFQGIDWEAFANLSKGFFGIMIPIMLVLCVIGYLVWTLIVGGRYTALFEMDENGIVHSQMAKQVKRQRLISEIGVLAGILTKNPTLAGNSLLAASTNSWESEFSNVRKVKPSPRRHLIKVNERLMHNSIYVENEEDYEFVLNYILQRCPRVKN